MAFNHEYIAELVSNQSWDECYSEIIKGLKQNYSDYELYFALGEYYLSKNIIRRICVMKMRYSIVIMKQIRNI